MLDIASPLEVRILKPKDLDLIDKAARLILTEVYHNDSFDDDQLDAMRDDLGRRDTVVLVDEDEEVASTASLGHLEPGHGTLQDVATRKSDRGRGYGTQVIDAVADIARAKGYSKMTTEPTPDSEPFYVKIGYREDPNGEWSASL